MKLLFEIGCEELPAAQVVPSLEHMAAGLARLAEERRVSHGDIATYATPRRLALVVEGLAARTPDIEETRVGPSVAIAFDGDGQPTRAAQGFAKGAGVAVEALDRVTTDKGQYVAARLVRPGQPVREVLPAILEAIVRGIPWPKPMRWGWNDEAWGRPVHWVVALLDTEVLPVQFVGIASGRSSSGHRFLHTEPVELARVDDYVDRLREAWVLVDIAERKQRVRRLVEQAAAPYRVVADEDLIDEVTHLVEYPWAARGTFSRGYLELPREVLISEMREHQRYFAVEDEAGALVNHFVVVYNTRVVDEGLVVRGNERVLTARLADGEFFLRRDRQRRLESRVDDLERVVFLTGLGSVKARAERLESLAGELADGLFGDPGVTAQARRAGWLCKADLTTEMVGEFPDLQGIMGREYALSDGEDPAVAAAIAQHYQPRGARDSVASSRAGVAAAVADKLDILASCFALGLEPTGTADPYGLRRAALGIIRTVLEHGLTLSLRWFAGRALEQVAAVLAREGREPPAPDAVRSVIIDFVGRRLRSYLIDEASPDVIDAVLATGLDDIGAAVAKVRALATMRQRDGFEPLAVAFKRVANILKEPPGVVVDESLFREDAERALWAAFGEVKERVEGRIEAGDFETAASALIELKEPVDRFFDDVLVMAEDDAVRANRLALLRDLRWLFEQMADISRIQVAG